MKTYIPLFENFGCDTCTDTTAHKLIATAIKDGHITKDEGSAMYVMDAAKKVAAEWDALTDAEKPVFRDTFYNNFLGKINKKPHFVREAEEIDKRYIRTIKFTHDRIAQLNIEVDLTPDGRIVEIRKAPGTRFPYSVGQVLNRNHESWAANNNYKVDGKNTGPQEKIFGVRVKDVPPGHEWRTIYPNKFRNTRSIHA